MPHRMLPMACLRASCDPQRSKAKPAAEALARGEKSLAAGNTARFASLLRAEGSPDPADTHSPACRDACVLPSLWSARDGGNRARIRIH